MNHSAHKGSANPEPKYPRTLRILHWVMTVGFLFLFTTGPVMVELGRDDPLRLSLFNLHKSIGVLALAFVAIRIAVRLRSVVPDFPPVLSVWERGAAHFAHRLLYLAMVIVPLTGWLASDIRGRAVKLFGLPLPKLFPTIANVGTWPGLLHTVVAYTLLGIVAVHLVAVLKHRLLDRHCVLRRIL